MLRGNSPATVDNKGRIKIPNEFRRYIEEKYGRECFVTSLDGQFARVYPMPVWLGIEEKIGAQPTMNPAITRFKETVNYYGQSASLDGQGRLLIHPLLRHSSGINGAVAVIGYLTFLDIWNREKFEALLKANPITTEDMQLLSSFGI
jgi:MraZ protein